MGDARHLSPSAQKALRLRAVAALAAGRDREDVAAVFGVSLKAVDIWWAKWQAGGREALVMQPRGKPVGVHQVLGEAEQAAVRQAVLDHWPCDVGLSGQLWTRRMVGELIAKLYRVRLTEPGVGKYLRRWGLSFQRPDKRVVEQDPQAVRRWHEETWPAIRAKAKKDGGEVLFAHQVGIQSDQVTGRTWGEKGKKPVVRRSGNRFSPACGLLPALRPTPGHRRTSRLPAGRAWKARQGESFGVVPTFTVIRSSGEAASFAPAASPRLRRSPSPWPPDRQDQSDPGVPARMGSAHRDPAQIHRVLSWRRS